MNTQNPSNPKNSRDAVSRLVFELSKLPGIGEKTATRLTYFILKQNPEYAQNLSSAVLEAKLKTGLCDQCYTFTDINPCRVCADHERDHSRICIVERPTDLHSLEMSGAFKGVYHVLHGALSPLDGIGPEELKIRELFTRLHVNPTLKEIILANNPSVEGEATALYLARLLKPLGLKITQLAHGLPVGGTLEYIDRQTIGKAMEHRVEMT